LRRQVRQFVVEVKSSRRRPKRVAASIWGDIDIKAAAREAEAEIADARFLSPFLTKVPSGSGVPEPKHPDSSQIQETSFGEIKDAEAAASAKDFISFETSAEPMDEERSAAEALCVATRSKRQPRSRRERKRVIAAQLPSAGRFAADHDDLDALIAENDRLKLLLRGKLILENALLRDLLARH